MLLSYEIGVVNLMYCIDYHLKRCMEVGFQKITNAGSYTRDRGEKFLFPNGPISCHCTDFPKGFDFKDISKPWIRFTKQYYDALSQANSPLTAGLISLLRKNPHISGLALSNWV